jgi:hypothetical protein
MRKGQIIGQVFVLILAAIVFILILAYGYKAIAGIIQRGDDAAFIDFTTNLKTEVSSIILSYGSVKKLELHGLPGRYKEICFITSDAQKAMTGQQETDLDGLALHSSLIYELYEPNGAANVFFIPSAPTNIKLEHIQAADDQAPTHKWFCEKVDQGSVTLRLEGLGNSVRISEWPELPVS